jgi:hypothetical protein
MSWDKIQLISLLSTETMQYLLNEPIINEITPNRKRYLMRKFKKRFKDDDGVRLYLKKKQSRMVKAIIFGLKQRFFDAYELLDFAFINDAKRQLTNNWKYNVLA